MKIASLSEVGIPVQRLRLKFPYNLYTLLDKSISRVCCISFSSLWQPRLSHWQHIPGLPVYHWCRRPRSGGHIPIQVCGKFDNPLPDIFLLL